MPIDTTVTAMRVESASASVANSSTGLVEESCLGLVNITNLRESWIGNCHEALSRYRHALVRTWAKPLMNRGDFVNLVTGELTPQESIRWCVAGMGRVVPQRSLPPYGPPSRERQRRVHSLIPPRPRAWSPAPPAAGHPRFCVAFR